MYLSRIILSCALKHVDARNAYCRFDPVISNHNSRRPHYIFSGIIYVLPTKSNYTISHIIHFSLEKSLVILYFIYYHYALGY